MEPKIRYCTASDGVRIAYSAFGTGPALIRLQNPFLSHLQLQWPLHRGYYERLVAKRTLVRFDPRGTGLSDRNVTDFSLDARVSDLIAVVNQLGLESFALHGVGFAGAVAIAYAAHHPAHVSHLVLDDAFASGAEYAAVPQNRALRELLVNDWDAFTENVSWLVSGRTRDAARQAGEEIREFITQATANSMLAEMMATDVSGLLSLIVTPALVVHHGKAKGLTADMGKDLAAGIPGAQLVLIEGLQQDNVQSLMRAIEAFLSDEPAPPEPAPGARGALESSTRPETVFRTILFTDLVDHTLMMQRLGDEAGRAVLREHERITRDVLGQYGGIEVKTDGDSFMASFTSATSALECAVALQRAFALHSASAAEPIKIRAGLNMGEPLEERGDYFGSAVILAARIKDQAGAGEILVPEALRHLLSGKSFSYTDRGAVPLKGFEDPVRLYEVQWRE